MSKTAGFLCLLGCFGYAGGGVRGCGVGGCALNRGFGGGGGRGLFPDSAAGGVMAGDGVGFQALFLLNGPDGFEGAFGNEEVVEGILHEEFRGVFDGHQVGRGDAEGAGAVAAFEFGAYAGDYCHVVAPFNHFSDCWLFLICISLIILSLLIARHDYFI